MKSTATEIDKAFFERNQQAAELRQVCVDFLGAWSQLSEASDIDRAVPESNLEAARERLVALGVTPGMHVGRDFDYFRTRPVAAAQFCAGQLLGRPATEADTAQLSDAYFNLDDVGSHEIADGVEAAILRHGQASLKKLIEHCMPRDVVRTVAMMLDAESEIPNS